MSEKIEGWDGPINLGYPAELCPHCGKKEARFGYADKTGVWYRCRNCYWKFEVLLDDAAEGDVW